MTADRKDRGIKTIRPKWRDVVLVCSKCSKKINGGFGPDGDQKFAKALRRSLLKHIEGKLTKKKRQHTSVIEVGCFDVCPKNAVVVVRPSNPDLWLVVPSRTPIDEAARRLQIVRADEGALAESGPRIG